MKKSILAAALTAALGAGAQTAVTWQNLGNTTDADGKPVYTQRFTVKGQLDFGRLGFNMFARGMKTVNPADTLIELVPGYYVIASPRLHSNADSVTIDIVTRGSMRNCVYAPDGLHRINGDGSTAAVAYTPMPLADAGQYATADRDLMPYGPAVYDANARRDTAWTPGVYDIVPSYKKVTPMPGTSTVRTPVFIDTDPANPEYYTIDVRNDSLIVSCRPDRQWAVMYPFTAKVLKPTGGRNLPNVHIENWPDHPWRGQHIDIARNYQTPATMHIVLDILAANHLNKLHFHFADDEAWRLEIPGLPELTDIGSRRGYSDHGEDSHLYQIFAGDGNPDSAGGTANGYWRRQEFIDFLRRAHTLGIDVLPEIESPGHARAAIKAMEARHRRGDDTYRLIHDGDTSRYTGAQAFHDNVMNPALPGPYAFMDKVFDELIAMYREAGVPLAGIHIGGDEVPRGAWDGSRVAQDFMAEHNIDGQHGLHGWFVRQLAKSLKQRGVPMLGWEEVAVGHGPEFNTEVAPVTGGVNCWHATTDAADKAVTAGYPVILSNVNRFYLDMAYSYHPAERGLTWGGTVDEFDALGGYADKLCPASAKGNVAGKVIGIQGQLWAETIRSRDGMMRLLLPKITGMAERAWNAQPTWTEAQFNAIVGLKELPLYSEHLAVHMRQPGIKVIDGMVHMNAPYPAGRIHYTTDGSVPTAESPVYSAPFALGTVNPADVRAVYIYLGEQSPVTYLSR